MRLINETQPGNRASAYIGYAIGRMRQGLSSYEVQKELEAKGMPTRVAHTIVQRLDTHLHEQPKKKRMSRLARLWNRMR